MGFMLGNLTVEEIQSRAGVTFPDELVSLMKETHQAEASGIKAGKWHCFDAPFVMVCGDIDIAKKIHAYLAPLSSKFSQKMTIALQ